MLNLKINYLFKCIIIDYEFILIFKKVYKYKIIKYCVYVNMLY